MRQCTIFWVKTNKDCKSLRAAPGQAEAEDAATAADKRGYNPPKTGTPMYCGIN